MQAMHSLLLKVRKELLKVADPKKARQMQAYMKSTMPYHGVPSPLVRQISKSAFADLRLSEKEWHTTVLYFWKNAQFREERYVAHHLCAHKMARDFQTPKALKMYEEMIVSGAWWDHVDDFSSRVGQILEKYPKQMKPKMLVWSRSSNLWKRRTSIICQRAFKKETDLDLLYSCIEPSMDSKEFFLQKAIGWALREYAWTNPKEIKRYVKENQKRLSSLSRREALKNL